MEFWLSFRNNKERLRLPVLPPDFEVDTGKNNTKVMLHELGEINLIGKSRLRAMSIQTFFPAQEYSFCEYKGFPKPYECVEQIEKWEATEEPIRLIITGTNINIPFAIENFKYGERDGTGDVYYSLDLSEYVFMNVKVKNNEKGYSQSGARPVFKEIPEKYIVQAGDTLGNIAKKLTGNFDNYKIIAARNNIKDPNVVTPGQELMIW